MAVYRPSHPSIARQTTSAEYDVDELPTEESDSHLVPSMRHVGVTVVFVAFAEGGERRPVCHGAS